MPSPAPPPSPAAAAAPPLLDIRALTVRFPGRDAVRALDLRIDSGEMLALVGESGCGKSTTALAVMRLLPAAASVGGSILLDGRDLLALPEAAMSGTRGSLVSMIFQEPMSSLNPLQPIGRQVMEAILLHRPQAREAARREAEALLERVRLPQAARRVGAYPHELSGGQRQRVMIAMAIACRPRLLIADEPTTALDVTTQAEILALIDQLRHELGMAVLLITHDLGVVSQVADRVAVMHGGNKLEEGRTGRIFAAPAHAYTRGLLAASLHGGRALHYTRDRLAEIHASADGSFHLAQSPQPAPQTLTRRPDAPDPAVPWLVVQDLRVSYAGGAGRHTAVDGLGLSLARGETLGLVGESGCGKSTLSRALMRLVPAEAGRIELEGRDLLALPPRELLPWRKRVQLVFQDPYGSLNPRHRVEDILGHALAIHGLRARAERAARIAAILDDVGLPRGAQRRYPHEFSGGQRQRIAIARALVLRPDLVICDEPVSALDVSIQAQILNLLVDLKAEYGLTYLFISHDLAVVRYIADRVAVMQAGRIVESGSPQALWSAPHHPYTRALLDAVPGRRGPRGEGLAIPQPAPRQALADALATC